MFYILILIEYFFANKLYEFSLKNKIGIILNIGFIIDLPNAEVIKIGNGSLEGATLMLLSKKLRNSIENLVKTIEHVELETTKDFFNFFVEGCQFKPIENELRFKKILNSNINFSKEFSF